MHDLSAQAIVDDERHETPPFDGVICFGGTDWWYHNRGHYDMQMMREFSKRVPVLFVNSIGMRAPKVSEGSMFLTRVRRKLKSIARGCTEARPNFHVFSPLTLPGSATTSSLVSRLLGLQVRRAARRCGIRRPLVWIACPPAASVVDALEPVSVVYQRTDRFESFHGVDAVQIAAFDRQLKARADLVLFCARALYDSERASCRNAAFVDHGVDFDHFVQAGLAADERGEQPADLKDIPRPRVGFIGGIDSHTFDPALFREVAGRLPHLQFVMVGACSLPDGWCPLPNVHFMGQRPYESVAGYMAACDVLIMPWNRNEWIEACNPVKLKEYLAVGRPIVSTPFPEIHAYSDHVAIAGTAEAFSAAIEQALAEPPAPADQRARAEHQDWQSKAGDVWAALQAAPEQPMAAVTAPR